MGLRCILSASAAAPSTPATGCCSPGFAAAFSTKGGKGEPAEVIVPCADMRTACDASKAEASAPTDVREDPTPPGRLRLPDG